jgi:hypothetical protein
VAMREEMTKFIEAYGAALSYGPSAAIEFYSEPCLTVVMGVARMHPTRKDMELVLADVDATDRTRGFTRADLVTVDVQPLGASCALATVQWAFKGACDELLWTATVSYNLYRCDGAWKILAQTTHDS